MDENEIIPGEEGAVDTDAEEASEEAPVVPAEAETEDEAAGEEDEEVAS